MSIECDLTLKIGFVFVVGEENGEGEVGEAEEEVGERTSRSGEL